MVDERRVDGVACHRTSISGVVPPHATDGSTEQPSDRLTDESTNPTDPTRPDPTRPDQIPEKQHKVKKGKNKQKRGQFNPSSPPNRARSCNYTTERQDGEAHRATYLDPKKHSQTSHCLACLLYTSPSPRD